MYKTRSNKYLKTIFIIIKTDNMQVGRYRLPGCDYCNQWLQALGDMI